MKNPFKNTESSFIFIIVTLNDLNIKSVVVAADFSLYIFSMFLAISKMFS